MAVKGSLNKNTMCSVWTTSMSSLSVESFRKINGKVWAHKSSYSELGVQLLSSLLHFRELTCLHSKERKFGVCAVWVSLQLSTTFPWCHKYCLVWILCARNALVGANKLFLLLDEKNWSFSLFLQRALSCCYTSQKFSGTVLHFCLLTSSIIKSLSSFHFHRVPEEAYLFGELWRNIWMLCLHSLAKCFFCSGLLRGDAWSLVHLVGSSLYGMDWLSILKQYCR